MKPEVCIAACGMVTGVGYNAPASCAAMRVGFDGFEETRFNMGGDWLRGCPVPLPGTWRTKDKLLEILSFAVQECLDAAGVGGREDVPILLCLPELGRPGRPEGLDAQLLVELLARLKRPVPGEVGRRVFPYGKISGARAFVDARDAVERSGRPCIIAGVDSLLTKGSLTHYFEQGRLLTPKRMDGFIPGEAAAAVLLRSAQWDAEEMFCCGAGFGQEPATVLSGGPLRADGLTSAIRQAIADAGFGFEKLDYRIADVTMEQYGFKEAELGLSRLLRERKERFDFWHTSDCVGEVGAAVFPLILGRALTAAQKGYAPGPGVLCHFGNDTGERGAVLLRYEQRTWV